MRELLVGERKLSTETGGQLTCKYAILIRELPPPISCESYGIRLQLAETGERAELADLTVLMPQIEQMASLLLRNGVTPCTLQDVMSDLV